VLESVGPAGLQGCWDYVSFPLLLLLDSVQQSRQEGAAAAAGQLPVPAAKSDRVAEAALRCIKMLHGRCGMRGGRGCISNCHSISCSNCACITSLVRSKL
jgi:hypothetical protein